MDQDRIVAFIDILGFKNLLKEWSHDKSIALKIENTLARSIHWIGGKEALKSRDQWDWSFHPFSDCFVIDVPMNDLWILNLFKGLAAFQRQMFQEGYLVRGGVSFGRHYKTDLITLSPPLVEAHDLESKQAVFPRIVLSDRLVSKINKIKDADYRKEIKEYLLIDKMEKTFICYFVFEEEDPWFTGEEFYRHHKQKIEDSIKLNQNSKEILAKYSWLAEYHNWCLRTTSECLKKSGRLTEDNIWDFASILIRGINVHHDLFDSLLWRDKAFDARDNYLWAEKYKNSDWVKDWPGQATPDDESDEGI